MLNIIVDTTKLHLLEILMMVPSKRKFSRIQFWMFFSIFENFDFLKNFSGSIPFGMQHQKSLILTITKKCKNLQKDSWNTKANIFMKPRWVIKTWLKNYDFLDLKPKMFSKFPYDRAPTCISVLKSLFRRPERSKAVMANGQREQNAGVFTTNENVSLEKWPRLFSKLDAESQSPEKD